MNRLYKVMIVGATAMVMFAGCDKNDNISGVIVPPSVAHFANNTTGAYYVQNDPASVFKVPVGISTVSTSDRKVTFSVTSPTGAGAAQYSIPGGNTVVIPAGKALDSIAVKGIFAGFPGTRRDTLTFKITGGDVAVGTFNDTYNLIMTKYCTVSLPAFAGTYTKCYDIQTGSPTYGPYSLAVSSPTVLTATTGYVMMTNVWDVGGPAIRVNLDWTNPAAFTTTIPAQFLYTDPTYGAATITGVGNGTFSSCDNTFSLAYRVTVAAGSFGNFTTTIAR